MLRPKQDYIVVKPLDRPQSDALIVVSDERPCRGEVISVGPGKEIKGKRFPLDVRAGETVRFKFHETYQKYEENGVTYLLIREPDIEFIEEMT